MDGFNVSHGVCTCNMLCHFYTTASVAFRSSQAFNCLYSQLDVLKCVPRPDTSWPGPKLVVAIFKKYMTLYSKNLPKSFMSNF